MITMLKIAFISTSLLCMTGTQFLQPQDASGTLPYTQKKDSDAYIGEDRAKEIAFKDAGAKEKDASYILVHLDMDDGVMVYDVEFVIGNTEYDYEIDAQTGEIREKDTDIEGNKALKEGALTKEEALKTALKDAGVKQKDTTYLYIHFDNEDGVDIYEVEFMAGDKEYDYEIDANTGAILDKDFEMETAGKTTSDKSAITKEKAKEIAVKDAGLAMKDVTFTKVKQEFEDGYDQIQVTFIYGETEYEYEIDAATGKILEVSMESVYDD